jgi:hypothetical protein
VAWDDLDIVVRHVGEHQTPEPTTSKPTVCDPTLI